MLLVLLVVISIGFALWLKTEGLSFWGSATIFCFFSVLIWLAVISIFGIVLPTNDLETHVIIDGFDYDSSFPHDSLSYIVDGEIYHVSGDISVFYGGSQDTLVIVEKFIDSPDWFWLISFMNHGRTPWSVDYFIY